jgi:hypothetical protein
LKKSGSIVITKAGTVIDGLDIAGSVVVKADDVTIKRTRVSSNAPWAIRVMSARRLKVTDVEIVGATGCEAGIAFNNYTATRVDMHGCEDGFRVGKDTLVEDSWIHDLDRNKGAHNDGIQASDGTNIVIRHNVIAHIKAQTSAILIKADFADVDGVLIEDNELNGGSYVIYVRDAKQWHTRNATIRNNRIGRDYLFGYLSYDIPPTWTGNTWLDTGEPIPPPKNRGEDNATDRPEQPTTPSISSG